MGFERSPFQFVSLLVEPRRDCSYNVRYGCICVAYLLSNNSFLASSRAYINICQNLSIYIHTSVYTADFPYVLADVTPVSLSNRRREKICSRATAIESRANASSTTTTREGAGKGTTRATGRHALTEHEYHTEPELSSYNSRHPRRRALAFINEPPGTASGEQPDPSDSSYM